MVGVELLMIKDTQQDGEERSTISVSDKRVQERHLEQIESEAVGLSSIAPARIIV